MTESFESYPKPHIDNGEERKQVIFGGARVTRFIKDVVAGQAFKPDGTKYRFDRDLVLEIHDRVSMAPGVQGFLRQTDSTTVGGEPVKGRYKELDSKMRVFGHWLEGQMEVLKGDPENLIKALEVAAGAHYGLTRREFHPFDNGNGRTARALMNAILMSHTYELTAFGYAIPPIPIVRTEKASGHYIRSLRAVGETGTLNPLMSFISHRWIESLDERLIRLHTTNKSHQTQGDKLLNQKLEKRRDLLHQFVETRDHMEKKHNGNGHANNHNGNGHQNGNGHNREYQTYLIPDYFQTTHVKYTTGDRNAA